MLAGRSWDAVLDTCAFVPREVRELAEAIGDRIGHYTLVSSLSVHPDDLPVGATEDTAIHQPPYPDTEDVTEETYGPLKVACEVEAAARFAEQAPRDPARVHRRTPRPHRPLHVLGSAGGRGRRDARRGAAGRADPGDRRARPRFVRPRSDRGCGHGPLRRRRTGGARDDRRRARGRPGPRAARTRRSSGPTPTS